MWAFKTLYDKGLVYEGFRVLAYCWRCETPLSNTETRMDDVYRDRQDPALTVGFAAARPASTLAGLDDDAVDAAVQPGRRGRPRHRLRRAAEPRRADAASASSWPRPGWRHYAQASSARTPRAGRRRLTGRRPGRAAATRRCSTSCRRRARTRFQVLAADFVTTEDGTGVVHMAPAFGEDDQVVMRRRRHPDRGDRRRPRPVHRAGAAVRRACRSSRRTSRSSATCKRAAAWSAAAGDLRPTRTRTAGAATHPLVYKAVSSLVRRGDRSSGPDGRAEPGDHLGARRTSRTARSASGWPTPATGRSAATGSGARRSRCGSRDDPTYPRVDVYGSLAELERDFGVRRRPTCTGRSSTS